MPSTPPPPPPIQLVETDPHPFRITLTKPVIRTSSPVGNCSLATPLSKMPLGVHSDSQLQPSGAGFTSSLDWSGDPLLAGLARILEALSWKRECIVVRSLLCLRGAHGIVDPELGSRD